VQHVVGKHHVGGIFAALPRHCLRRAQHELVQPFLTLGKTVDGPGAESGREHMVAGTAAGVLWNGLKDRQRLVRQRHEMRRVRLESLRRDRPDLQRLVDLAPVNGLGPCPTISQHANKVRMELAPPGFRDFALALPCDRQKPEQRAVGTAQALGCPPEGRDLVIRQDTLARLLFADQAARSQAVAWRDFQAVLAPVDRPVKKRPDVAENVVSLIRRRPIGDGVDKLHHIGARDLGQRLILPVRNDLAPDLALNLSRLALALDVPGQIFLYDGPEGEVTLTADFLLFPALGLGFSEPRQSGSLPSGARLLVD
jgi:hypothetical protein